MMSDRLHPKIDVILLDNLINFDTPTSLMDRCILYCILSQSVQYWEPHFSSVQYATGHTRSFCGKDTEK